MKTLRWCGMTMLVGISVIMVAAPEAEYRVQPAYLVELLKKLKNGENVTFAKFGDGEYLCMSGEYLSTGREGHNCDGDQYHEWLGTALKNAFIGLSKKSNTYIGQWYTVSTGAGNAAVHEYYITLARRHGVKIPFVSYHLIMNDDSFLHYPYMHDLVEFLVHTKRKKIVMGNACNRPLKDLFRADVYVEIPPRSWSFEYETWKNIVASHLEKDAILLTAGGLCSKVLINDLTDQFAITCLDIGSSFDIMGSKIKSRWPRLHSYEDELRYYHDLLPSSDATILIEHVKKSIENAKNGLSKLDNLLNDLCCLPYSTYLKVDMRKGSTLDKSPFNLPINLYFYGGDHTHEAHYQAFTYCNDLFADVFIAVVDGWNHRPVQTGTRQACADLGYQVLFEETVPAQYTGDTHNCWNDVYVGVIKKK